MAKRAKNTGEFLYHIPILVTRILSFVQQYLEPEENFWILDGTLGDGGHTLAFLGNYTNCRIIALDRDQQMLARAQKRMEDLGYKVSRQKEELKDHSKNNFQVFLLQENYQNSAEILKQYLIAPHIVLIDAGLSMFHFRSAKRGFSYLDDELDMRLDYTIHESKNTATNKTAQQIINSCESRDLLKILQNYGQQKFAKRIVDAVIQNRPIQSARELAEIVKNAIPFSKPGIHPATTVFQALRIYVNDELGSLEKAISGIPATLAPGGLFFVISFHSLEDRIVKVGFREFGQRINHMKNNAKKNNRNPVKHQKIKDYIILTPVPEQVGQTERRLNPASRSAKMRVLMKRPHKDMSGIQIR